MDKETEEWRIVIAGDLFPVKTNIDLFNTGNIEELYGEKIINLFKGADYSVINLEGVLTDNRTLSEKIGPHLLAPLSSIKGIERLGVKAIALANNHSLDAGTQGCIDTLQIINESGLDYVGVGTQEKMKKYLSIQLGSKKICIYNVSDTFIYNIPGKDSYGAHLYDEYLVCNEIKELKLTHDYVIVIYHSGSEYFQYPTPVVSQRCHRMIDCGADVITTQHSHCIGCEEFYKDAYILYGQGNFCFGNHKDAGRQKIAKQGIVLELVLTGGRLTIWKHLTSIHDNRFIRYEERQDFSSFDERSKRVAAGEDFSEELQKLKFDSVFYNYVSAYKGYVPFLQFLKKHFPKIYRRYINSSYSRKQTLIILATLISDRRNEEFSLIWKNIHDNYAKK